MTRYSDRMLPPLPPGVYWTPVIDMRVTRRVFGIPVWWEYFIVKYMGAIEA